jgi:flagellar biosynthetic protein FliP
MDGDITTEQAFERGLAPFQTFMQGRVRPDIISSLAEAIPGRSAQITPDGETPLALLIPSFMLSEIERAFEIGFMIFLPFLVIDLVVASVLMSMGMMMVPPVVVSLPLKLMAGACWPPPLSKDMQHDRACRTEKSSRC